MTDRDFEAFLLEQVRRESALYYGIMIALGCCAIACIVMAAAAVIVFGRGAIGISFKLIAVFAPFAGGCCASRFIAHKNSTAAEEMVCALEDPEWMIPDDYMDETIDARLEVCHKLKSIRGLIVSYSILAIVLWAAGLLFIFLSELGTSDFDLIMLLVAFVMFAMALSLSILAVAHIMDLPAARRYRQLVDENLESEQ